MIKILFHLLLLIPVINTNAQDSTGAVSSFVDPFTSKPVKASVTLLDRKKLKGFLGDIKDSSLSFLLPVDASKTIIRVIDVRDIRSIRVKRNSFLMGFSCGLVFGAIVGYYAGRGLYKYNFALTDSQNDDEKKGKGVIGAVVTAVPASLISGLITSLKCTEDLYNKWKCGTVAKNEGKNSAVIPLFILNPGS